jgi:CRISPR system Cascade subunit CasE
MYLSRLTLNPGHPLVRRDLANPYELHRTLTRAFARASDQPPDRFLWRLERRADAVSSTLLVQSEVLADWSILEAMSGYLEELRGNKLVDLEVIVAAGRAYRFRLLANPTVTRAGKRLGIAREPGQLAWLGRQGARHGFQVRSCLICASERLKVRQGKSGNRIVLDTALFEGVLEVVSADLLRKTLVNGLGHGKALGLGLMSLARVPS